MVWGLMRRFESLWTYVRSGRIWQSAGGFSDLYKALRVHRKSREFGKFAGEFVM